MNSLRSPVQEFDSSFRRNKPFQFTIGLGQVRILSPTTHPSLVYASHDETIAFFPGDPRLGRGCDEDELGREGQAHHHR